MKLWHLNIPQMKASYVSMILFVSRAWDAVSDPLVGYLVGLSNWTPIGKLTPWWVGGQRADTVNLKNLSSLFPLWDQRWCFVSQADSVHSTGCPLLSAAVVCAAGLGVSNRQRALVPHGHLPLWKPHECESACNVKAMYTWDSSAYEFQHVTLPFRIILHHYSYCSCSWSHWSFLLVSVLGWQCYNVPYLSLNMFLGGDHRDRDSATAYSKSVAMPDPRCQGGEGRVSHCRSVSPLSQSSSVFVRLWQGWLWRWWRCSWRLPFRVELWPCTTQKSKKSAISIRSKKPLKALPHCRQTPSTRR